MGWCVDLNMKNIITIIFSFCLLNFVYTQTFTNNNSMIDSSKEPSNSITLAGASSGLITGTSMILLSVIAGQDVSGLEALVIFLGPSFINGVIVPNYLESQNKSYLRTGILFSSCATTVMPMFGAMFGAPNSNFLTHLSFIAMGTAAGAIYNHILALIFPKYKSALQSAKFKKTLLRSNR